MNAIAPKPFAFVLMPFDYEFDDIYKLGIQPVAQDLNIVAERVDEQTFSESILERIYRQIQTADLVIADMTGRNPNVFYEVGYAHALQKPCTLLTQRAEDIPFDLKHHRHLIYEKSIQRLRQQLKAELIWILAEIQKKKTSTFTIELKKISAILDVKNWYADAEVEIKIDILNRSDRRSPEIEAIYLYTGPGWEHKSGQEECPSTEAEVDGKKMVRHFIKSPISRLSPNAWAQLNITGRKRVWASYLGQERKDSYRLQGLALIEIVTSEGTIRQEIHLNVIADEIPF